MADCLGDSLITGIAVSTIDIANKVVTLENGSKICADVIVSTIPWNSLKSLSGISKDIIDSIKDLKHSSIETRYVPKNLDTKAQWIYIPDVNKPYHRILVRHNFAPESKGYWLETRKERCNEYNDDSYSYMNEYAYPLNTIGKPMIVEKLLSACRNQKVYGLGRWGEHSHYNSDLVVSKAIELSKQI